MADTVTFLERHKYGGVPPENYSRDIVIADLLAIWVDMGMLGPEFMVDGPNPTGGRLGAAGRWGGWITTFSYVFVPGRPWFAEQVVRAFRLKFEELAGENVFKAPRVTIKLRMEEETGPKEAPYPRSASLAGARSAAINFGIRTIATLDLNDVTDIVWARIVAVLAREDHYDGVDHIEETFGNRMSRVSLIVNEWRLPPGEGLIGSEHS